MGTHTKTTIEISKPLLQQAKAHAAREKTTLRALVEAGLRHVLAEARKQKAFVLRDASFRGSGLSPEFRDSGWDRIREALYEDRT